MPRGGWLPSPTQQLHSKAANSGHCHTEMWALVNPSHIPDINRPRTDTRWLGL